MRVSNRVRTIITGAIFVVLCAACWFTPPARGPDVAYTPSPFTWEAIPYQVSSPTPSPIPNVITLTPTPSPTQAVCKVYTRISNGVLNLRSCAGLDCPALAWLNEGDELHPLPTEQVGQWLPVESAGRSGWVYAAFTDCGGKP